MTTEEFKNLALSFPATISNPHFDRTAFKVENKRIFATLHELNNSANIKLNLDEQRLFCEHAPKIAHPVPNKWGLQGWTTFHLENASRELILSALDSAFTDAAKPKKKGL